MKNKSDVRGSSSGSTHSSRSDRNRVKSNEPSAGRNPSTEKQKEFRNQSGRAGSTSQSSRNESIDTDGGEASRQTTEAGSQKGQL